MGLEQIRERIEKLEEEAEEMKILEKDVYEAEYFKRLLIERSVYKND